MAKTLDEIYFMVSLLNIFWFWIDFLGLLEVSGVLVSKKKNVIFFTIGGIFFCL